MLMPLPTDGLTLAIMDLALSTQLLHEMDNSGQDLLGTVLLGTNVMDKAVGCYAYGNMFCWL